MTDSLSRQLMYEAIDLAEKHGLSPEAAVGRVLSEQSDLSAERREILLGNALAAWPHFVEATKPPARSGGITTKELHLEATQLGELVKRGEITLEDGVRKLLDTNPDRVVLEKVVHALASNPLVYLPNGWPPYQIANSALARMDG